MTYCKECGKNHSILEDYLHPTLEKKNLLCSTCFDAVSVSVDNWRTFVNANSFNKYSSNMGLKIDLNKIFTSFSKKYGNYIKISMEKKYKY